MPSIGPGVGVEARAVGDGKRERGETRDLGQDQRRHREVDAAQPQDRQADDARAADLMDRHLAHIEGLLDIRDAVETPADIRSVFAR